MVFRGEMRRTTTRPERPKTLHNFTLPSSLKWGSQRHLTCTKIESTSSGYHRLRRRSPPTKVAGSSSSSPFRFGESDHLRSEDNNDVNQHRRSRNAASFKSVDNGGGEEEMEGEGIEEFRVKIMSDLKTVRDKITRSMYALGGEKQDDDEEEERRTDGGSGHEEKEVSPVKPWNLRKRRAAACKEATEEERVVNPSPPSPPSRNDPTRVVKERAKEMVVRPKFSAKLSKKEIEEDFMAFVGHRPPRRPKKRPRTVQKILDSLHPAFYLTEVTLDDYKVEETKR